MLRWRSGLGISTPHFGAGGGGTITHVMRLSIDSHQNFSY
jgi:hypothetical protein